MEYRDNDCLLFVDSLCLGLALVFRVTLTFACRLVLGSFPVSLILFVASCCPVLALLP